MYTFQLFSRKSLAVIFTRLMLLLIIFHIVSCECDNKSGNGRVQTDNEGSSQYGGGLGPGPRGGENDEKGKIAMSVERAILAGDQKTIAATFTLVDQHKEATLEEFTLKADYTKGTGKLGYTVYGAGVGISKSDSFIREKLVQFSSSKKKLAAGDTSLKVEILLEPGKGVNQLSLELQLLDKRGNVISRKEVKWEKEASPVNLKLTANGPTTIKGDEPILLRIHNQGTQPIEPGKAKLRIKRNGSRARIAEARYVTYDTEEIILERITVGENIDKTLSIAPNMDLKATFSFQLVYEEEGIGEAIEISWRKEPIRLEDVNYDHKNRQVTCKIKKTTYTYESIAGLKVVCKNKAVGEIKLGGETLLPGGERAFEIAHISPYSGNELGELDFGSNRYVDLEFRLQYEGGETTPIAKTFSAAEIKIDLRLTYDLDKGQVKYTLTNSGKDVARNVKLMYKNISAKEGEQPVLLDGKKDGETISVNLQARDGKTTGQLPISFNFQEEATFEFKVAVEEIVLAHLTQQKDFKAPEVKLRLTLSGHVYWSTISLRGGDKGAKLKIVQQEGSGEVDLKNLKVVIKQVNGNKGFLATKPNGGSKVEELTGLQLGNIGEEIELYVVPNGEEKLEFKVDLFYKEKEMNLLPLTVAWQESEAKLKLSFVEPSMPASTTSVKLEEPAKSIKVKIEPQPGSGSIYNDQLKLVITKITAGKGFLTRAGSNTKITQLTGAELGDLGKELTLDIHPEGDEKVEFQLQLVHKDILMRDPLTVSWKGKETSVRLNLIDPKPKQENLSFIKLEESAKAIKLKIEQAPDSGMVDMKQLKLAVTRTVGNTGFISTSEGGNPVSEIVGNQLGNIGDEIALYINPKQDEDLEFKLQLYYKGNIKHIPLRLSWNKDKVEMEALNPFIGDEETSFKLSNNASHPISWEGLRHFTVEVSSDNKSKFTFIKKDNTPIWRITTLDKVYDSSNGSVRLKLGDANGEKHAIVTVTITKEGSPVALDSKKTVWKEQGNKLDVSLAGIERNNYLRDKPIEIELLNLTELAVNTQNIKVKLTNSKGLTIELNKKAHQGEVNHTLQDILKKDKIDGGMGSACLYKL